MASRPKARKGGAGKRAACSAEPSSPPPLSTLQPYILHQVLGWLPQTQRVHVGEVCRAWREATLSPALWSHLYFRLPRDDDEETAEAFVSWLLPRVGQVETLHIDIQDVAQPPNQATDYVVGVMSNITAALMCVANSLRHLTFETQGCLVVSQWAAALTRLESACFIGGDVHLKQGLGKLQRLTDLEFGSNVAELEVESAACWPPSVTHLSLEHCSLTRLPRSLTRLTQLRSLDLSQNTFSEEDGDETAVLAELTGLECLKLANCRMTQVPRELGMLRKLRILHMGGNLEEEFAEAEDAEALEAALRPLRALQVLVISQCNVMLPDAVRKMPKLERLFVTSTPVTQLVPGAYCKSMRHLCVDWDVAFESRDMLAQCASMEMLTLARPHRTEQPDGQTEEGTDELARVLLQHPSLRQVNIVAVQGRGLHLSIHTLRFVLALSQAAPRLTVQTVDTWDSDLVRIPNLVDFP